MRLSRALVKAGVLTSVVAVAAPTAAYAGVSVGGDSNWSITVTTSVSSHYPKVGNTVTGNVNLVYDAHFLGIPLPVTGYYISSFPYLPFARPTLLSANAPLDSTTYSYTWDAYMGKNAWTVRGSKGFWGDATVYVKGSAKVDTAKVSGYFHGGTGTGHSIDANAIDYVGVS